ncbi:hypothetical protein F475_05813 [Pseudomonas sp. URMO17WK12:I6]|nr:hypothetical protein F475_05813 [Pseudomonas sp. URMO17WK12:I6]
MKLTGSLIEVNPADEAIEFYKERGDEFQMINIVVCCYAFERIDGRLVGLPYHISLRPAQKNGKPQKVEPELLRKLDLSRVLDGFPRYMGYNPFSNTFGLYVIGNAPIAKDICSDVVGIVYKTYFLASKYTNKDVCDPGLCTILLGESKGALSDYRKFRFDRYFKTFTNITPVKIWGCDSPIELFLLQGMSSLGLRPEIQMIIFSDGSTFPSLQNMWERGKRTKAFAKKITEADFFFEEQKIAVFCDSVAYHSSPEAIAKDKEIDRKLEAAGIRSVRVSGRDIAASPMECARRIFNYIND